METLYLIQHKNIPDYTKIGYTSDLPNRMKQLQTASPTGVHLVYSIVCENAYKLEQHLHANTVVSARISNGLLCHEKILSILFFM